MQFDVFWLPSLSEFVIIKLTDYVGTYSKGGGEMKRKLKKFLKDGLICLGILVAAVIFAYICYMLLFGSVGDLLKNELDGLFL